jgi:hypothetical protein
MFCVVLVFYGVASHCIQCIATKGEIDLKRSLEFLPVRSNAGQCDRAHCGRTQGARSIAFHVDPRLARLP